MELLLPRDAWYSFFNSPYPAHRRGTALDVYFEEEALVPVERSLVAEIRWFDAPGIMWYIRPNTGFGRNDERERRDATSRDGGRPFRGMLASR